ncbi:MAG TPA: DNA translocase FtsK 4TM domain-containing protein [Candidatus Limnocylindrales bacterium]|nr:DNA translocase FtsK 4TM domain-containing protein [Candidatus Limnocylindrales bacterium]
MATRKRTSTRRRSSPRTSRRHGALSLPSFGPGWHVSPDVARSIVGVALLAVGAVTLIALMLPGEGTLTTWWRNAFAPFFGAGRWVLPFVLLAAGFYVERASSAGGGWQLTLLGATLSFVAMLGLIDVLMLPSPRRGVELSGGYIGTALGGSLSTLLSPPGAFVVLVALAIAGLLIMLDTTLHGLVAPFGRGVRGVASVLSTPRTADAPNPRAAGVGADRQSRVPGRPLTGTERIARSTSAGQTAVWGPDAERPAGQTGPVSATFAPLATAATAVPPAGAGDAGVIGGPPGSGNGNGTGRPLADASRRPAGTANGGPIADASVDAEPDFALPPRTLLDDVAPRNGGAGMDHMRNADIIVSKLAGFNIPARVVRWNAGPVVTQYEVEPDPSIKVSRIEALADDLSMALAARTIRIEAPIPGKSVVGLEIPNNDFNVVALRRILDEVDFAGSGSKLTFALGRDVAGHARAADLAKMPHLLIAGATGSGKSVMVNALITSLLMNATPDDVRMILMDLKRVELASYNGLPHLLVPVITEPEKAKAALKWTVNQMEHRYRQFAGAGARNIAGYNETRADPADRLPYLVVIVDELADLMMREGKNIEDPIVRLAQKARATGIHMVLATQRPSVNVVTGLIKANFPSRIAFAMASQIDSRTILDAPGAEDLIGRGDMLFQPADLPRPIRLQGVFVSDKEIGRVTEYWRSWKEHYDLGIIETGEEGSGSAEALDDDEADRLLPDAVEVIREYDRASASLLQRRLKIGYARAARIIDQLEARGYIGAFDGSNARQVLRREEPVSGTGSGGFDDDDE